MKQSNDSIQLRYEWADRGMQQYLMLIKEDDIWNMQLAKVYYQDGEVRCSIRGLPAVANASTVAELVRARKSWLEAVIARKIAKRLDEATQGEI
jgi:hypothetical protein